MKKILITGGHMTPALAVISKLKERGEYKFVWVGHKYNQFGNSNTSAEYNTIQKLGIPFVNLHAGKLTRSWGGDDWIAGIRNLFLIPWGFLSSIFILIKHKPNLIMSFGGYLALPIAIIGKLFSIKVVTHEQTVVTGLTNRIIPKFADKILISWPNSMKYYPQEKTVVTGNPIRPKIFAASSNDFAVNPDLPTIYITGGNQGSHKINSNIFPILDDLLQVANVIHQTGNSTVTQDYETSKQLLGQFKDTPGRYIPRDYVYAEHIGEVFSKSDLVIARSGANTVYEILALGKPSIFIPIPWVTHNEQLLNAKLAEETGLSKVIAESNLNHEVLLGMINIGLENTLNHIGYNGENLDQVIERARSVIKLDAAARIVSEIESLL